MFWGRSTCRICVIFVLLLIASSLRFVIWPSYVLGDTLVPHDNITLRYILFVVQWNVYYLCAVLICPSTGRYRASSCRYCRSHCIPITQCVCRLVGFIIITLGAMASGLNITETATSADEAKSDVNMLIWATATVLLTIVGPYRLITRICTSETRSTFGGTSEARSTDGEAARSRLGQPLITHTTLEMTQDIRV